WLDLDHALQGADGQPGGAGGEELPEVGVRLRNAHEPSLEDRQEDVGREAPVADPHDPCADPDWDPVDLAHVELGRLVVPAARYEPPDRDAVPDQRDIEDEQANGGEPERALRKARTRKRTTDDPRQDVPAQTRRHQRAAA